MNRVKRVAVGIVAGLFAATIATASVDSGIAAFGGHSASTTISAVRGGGG